MDRTAHGASGASARRLLAAVLVTLLAVTMIPVAGLQLAFADSAGEDKIAENGLLYKVIDSKATLVGFEEGALLEGDVVVPESVEDATVTAVDIAEGQVAEGVTSLTLPQAVESVKTEGLASAFPSLSSIEVDGTAGTYSSSGGMLFLQGKDAASSDGSTTLAKNRELVWAPPALVVARLPIECKSIAPGAFTDAAALETVMCPGVMESIAVAEKDEDGNVTVPGAFTDEQIASLSIVVPGTNIASPSGDRVSASVALSEDEGMEAKREAWWKHGFNSDKIVMGTSFGEVEGVVTVSDDGVAENPSIDVLKPYEKKELAEAAESGDAEAAARLAAPEGSGLSFSYNADMNLSVSWAGDKTATPAAIEIPAYVAIDGVKYAVTEVAPEAFKGAVFLTSVTIPEGIRVVGESAFEGCANLKEVVLPSTLRTIDYAAFKGTAIESVEIPEEVTYIGGEAFAGCADLIGSNISILGHPVMAATAGFEVVDKSNDADDESLQEKSADGEMGAPLASYAAVSRFMPVGEFKNFVLYQSEASNGNYRSYDAFIENPALRVPATFPWVTNPGYEALWFHMMDTWGGSYDVGNYFVGCSNSFTTPYWGDTTAGPSMSWFATVDGEPSRGLRIYEKNDTGFVFSDLSKKNGEFFVGGNVLIQFDADSVGAELTPYTFTTIDHAPMYGSLPTPPARDGYKFLGWTLDGDIVSSSSQVPKNTGIYTLVAKWDDIESSVSLEGVLAGAPDGKIALAEGSFRNNATLSDDGKFVINPAAWGGGEHSVYAKVESNGDLRIYAESSTSSNIGCTLQAPRNPGYYLDKWVIDGVDVTPADGLVEISNTKSHTFKLVYPPKRFSVTYNPNGGTWGDIDGAGMDNKQANKVVEGRTFPEGAEMLSDLTREGFWLVGWSMQGNTETVDADRTKEEYSDFTLTAVWQPRVYRIEYDVNAANNNTAAGAADITAPGNSYFVHPAAIPAVYDEGEDGTRTLKANLNSLGIRQGQLNADASWYAYGLPHPNNKDNALGYVFAGWSTDDREIGVKPDHGPWTNFQTDADMLATLFPSQTNDVPRGSSGESYQWGNNYARVYSTWLSYEAVPVTLGADGPVGPATKTDGTGDGEAVSATALDGSATGAEPAKQTIYYWPEKGLVKGTYNNKQNTGEVVAASGDDLTLKGGMSLSAMGRYGYRFIGWGVRGEGYADDPDRSKCVVYAYYDEKGKTIKLTDAGAAKVAEWNAKPWKGSYDPADKEWTIDVAYAPTEWAALWEVRTYDVTLRLPASAVNSVKLNNGDYTWIEDRTTAGAPGANPSWYVGKKTWKYWDTLAVPEPKYNLNTGFNTYEGWYNDKEKMYDPTAAGAVSTDTAGRKVATESDVYKGTAFNVMKKTSVDGDGNAVAKPSGTWGNLFVEETRDSATRDQFGYTNATDKTRVADGEVELWLRYTPVYINATAPMGVWLANDEATGGAYVVGSDKRMHLETKASFTVKTDTTHDLVLTDVKATDIVSATATQGGTGAADTVSDVVLDEGANTGTNGKGFCETLLNVYSGNDDTSKVYYNTDSSRMFWIAPESTVSYNATLGEANATADANDKRRYFGFGHVEGDNVLHGDAGVKGKENVLDAFRLKHGASTSAGGLGGLTVGSAGDGFKNYDFYYGLDLRRCKIDPSAAQTLLEASNKAAAEAGSEGGAWEYNEPHKQPLVRVMFTFAVERNELVSYSARMGETFDAAAVAASAGAVSDDEAPEVFVGPALS